MLPVHPPQPLLYLTTRLHFRVPSRKILLVAAVLFLNAAVLAYAAAYLWPRQQTLSYASANCTAKPTFLPQLQKLTAGGGLAAEFTGYRTIAGYPVFSRSICVALTDAPQENSRISVAVHPLRIPFLKHTTTFASEAYPNVSPQTDTVLPEKISTRETLTLPLNKPDNTFEYALTAAEASVPCTKSTTEISCDVEPLALTQAATYELSIIQKFKDKQLGSVASGSVQTVTPVNIIDTSIKPDALVYEIPAGITVTFDKPLAGFDGVSLTQADGTPVEITTEKQGAAIFVAFKNPLARNTGFTLAVAEANAEDKGFLQAPFSLSFSTSGGPKVTGKNIGSYDVSASPVIRLTFDIAINPATAAQFIQVNGGAAASVSIAGNSATITPANAFGRCETFTITVLDGIQSVHGVSGGSAFKHTARTTCRSVFSIGTSAEGRAITAYKFGTCGSAILYVGGTHGNEVSSKSTLDAWVSYLESVATDIPASRCLIVIPNVNPDGTSRNIRTNAQNVDLNRNFPANNWKADITMPGGQLVVGGGGSSPLSAPESAALASYTQALQPRLVLTYHASGSIVTANESGDSMALATIYGHSAGYWAIAESQLGNTFNYDTTGAYENWLHDKAGIPTLLIELPTTTGNYLNSNRAAMWHMVNL